MYDPINAALSITERLAALSDAAEQTRRVDDEAVRAIQEAGLMRLMSPKWCGGLELAPRAQILSCAVTATACSAASWVQMVCGAHTYMVGRYPRRCQDEVFDTGPDVLIPGTLAPQGVAVRTNGGWRLTGRWQFGSGCDHGPWFVLGARVDEGSPGGVHAIVPFADIEIDDTWRTLGMRGTGSKDIVAHDLFVPDYRAMATGEMFLGTFEGEVAPLYRLPVLAGLASMLSGTVLGFSERGLQQFVELTMPRQDIAGSGAKAAKAAVQIRVAESGGELALARLLVERNCDRFDQALARGNPVMDLAERAEIRWDAAYAVELCRRATERIYAASGAHAVYDDSALQKTFRDVNTACHHAIVDFDGIAETMGRLALGLSPATPMV